MQRSEVLIAVAVFIFLITLRAVFAFAKIQDNFIGSLDTFAAATFGSLLTLFQQRIRQVINTGKIDELNAQGSGPDK